MIENAYIDSLQVHDGANIALTGVSGLGSPPPRRASYSRARRHGAVDNTRYYEGRVIGLTGECWTTAVKTAAQAFDELKAALALDGETQVFKFRRTGFGEDERVEVIVASDLTWDIGEAGFITWGVSLFAGDPLIYADAQASGSYDPTTANSGKGLSFPLVFPLVFAGEATTTLDVDNGGTFPTPPVFTISGPVTNPVIDNETTGESIYTDGLTLASGETATIDVPNRELRLGGGATETYSAAVAADSPASYWRLEEASSADPLADEQGVAAGSWVVSTGVSFQVNGPVKSESEKCIVLDGSGYWSAGDVYDFAGLSPFTVEAWVRPDTLDANLRRIVSKESDPGTGREGWNLSISNSQVALTRYQTGASNVAHYDLALSEGVWYHVVATFDGETNAIYVNAVQGYSNIFGTTREIVDASGDLLFGIRADTLSGSSAWIGGMDEVAIYDRALTPDEVQEHYIAGLSSIGDGTPRADLIDPRLTKWFDLAPGTNSLRLRGDGLVAGQSRLQVTYRDARI